MIEAVGLNETTSEVSKADMTEITTVLGVGARQIERPIGKIDLFIGADYSVLVLIVEKMVGDLQLMKSQFGYCVRGYLGPLRKKFSAAVNHVRCMGVDDFVVKIRSKSYKAMELFFKTEEIGVTCSPQCGGCRCGKCSLKGYITLKEKKETKVIEEGLHYDERLVAKYQWINDPSELPNNYSVAYDRLLLTKRRLNKLGNDYANQYSE